jgi:hypothetical protein
MKPFKVVDAHTLLLEEENERRRLATDLHQCTSEYADNG